MLVVSRSTTTRPAEGVYACGCGNVGVDVDMGLGVGVDVDMGVDVGVDEDRCGSDECVDAHPRAKHPSAQLFTQPCACSAYQAACR